MVRKFETLKHGHGHRQNNNNNKNDEWYKFDLCKMGLVILRTACNIFHRSDGVDQHRNICEVYILYMHSEIVRPALTTSSGWTIERIRREYENGQKSEVVKWWSREKKTKVKCSHSACDSSDSLGAAA